MTDYKHQPVLLEECIGALNIRPDGTYLDGTLGGGGHSEEILKRLDTGRLIAIDRDARAIERASRRLAPYSDKVIFVQDNFRNFDLVLDSLGISAVSGMLFDFGMSSPQLDESERGFSYMPPEASLDMRMDESESLTAKILVNEWPEGEISKVLRDYGEERYARQIARAIVRAREERGIETTLELVDIIRSALPAAALREKQHPAKRSFQGIRIAINDELGAISELCGKVDRYLEAEGRFLAITFHSLEDRIVKRAINEKENGCTCPRDFPVCICGFKQSLKSVGRKPIIPSDEEIRENPRARSAKLRVAERV